MIGRHMTVVVMVMARLVGSAQGSRMGFKEGGWAVVRFRLTRTKHIYIGWVHDRVGYNLVIYFLPKNKPVFCFIVDGIGSNSLESSKIFLSKIPPPQNLLHAVR